MLSLQRIGVEDMVKAKLPVSVIRTLAGAVGALSAAAAATSGRLAFEMHPGSLRRCSTLTPDGTVADVCECNRGRMADYR